MSSDADTTLNPPRRPEQVDVHWLDLRDQPADRASALIPLLNEDEQRRLESFRNAADSNRYLFGAVMVRQLTGERLGVSSRQVPIDRRCPSCDRHHGRPSVIGSDLQISVTHSGDVVGVAVCLPGRVGLDVERVDPRLDPTQLVPRILHPHDSTSLSTAGLSDEQLRHAFFDHWTAKEAALKAVGSGLRIDPRVVAIETRLDSSTRIASVPGHRQLQLHRWMPKGGHLATVATEPSAPVCHHRLREVHQSDPKSSDL